MSESLEARRWDEIYGKGGYFGEDPIDFCTTILDTLGEERGKQFGLYVGCGNGRNYIPLAEGGLRLHGIDISSKAIRQIEDRYPEAPVLVRELDDFQQTPIWDYIAAIEIFHYGDKETIDNFFTQSRRILKPGGRLFLRVNSVRTESYYKHIKHRKIEGNKRYGYTMLYEEDPLQGMKMHFYTERELGSLAAKHFFNVEMPPEEAPERTEEQRKPSISSAYTQWETIWQKI